MDASTSFRGLLVSSLAILATACGGGGSSNNSPQQDQTFSGRAITFQKAAYVIGQPDFVSNTESGTPTATSVSAIMSSYGDDTLYLPDENNHRILGYRSLPKGPLATADFVIGQPDFTSSDNGSGVDQLDGPRGALKAENRLFVVDSNNNRVLIFNPAPQDGPASATIVVGKPGFDTTASECSSSSLLRPGGVAVADGKLIISDSSHNRVLIWNSIPTEHGQPADLVLGQANFNECQTNAGGYATASASSFHGPSGVWSDGTRLAVNDGDNHRILIWNTFPTEADKAPDLVLGQSDFTHNESNDDNQDGVPDTDPDSGKETTSARTMYFPYGQIAFNGKQFFVPDSDNHRILVWNGFPTESFQPADIVLGQSDFTSLAHNDDNQDGEPDTTPSERTFYGPYGLTLANGTHLIVGDYGNYRALVFELNQ